MNRPVPVGGLGNLWPAGLTVAAIAAYAAWSRIVVSLWPHWLLTDQLAGRNLEGYFRFDGYWYLRIATQGYSYNGPRRQASVAFFPGYPLAVRAANAFLHNPYQAGILVAVLAAPVAVQLLHSWVSSSFDARTAAIAVALVVAWPYAYYLFGVIYSDALFLVFTFAAFVLLERGHPWLATLAATAATASRPVGVAVTAGLLVRALERDGVLRTRWSPDDDGPLERPRLARLHLRRLRLTTLAPAASIAGMVGYCAFLWYRFGEPFAFVAVGGAPGWQRRIDARTIAKYGYFHIMSRHPVSVIAFTLTLSGLLTALAFGLVPRVARRLGAGYALYTLIAIGLPFASSPEFIGMGRYDLAAFPSFAAGAELLGQKRLASRVIFLACSSVLLVGLAALFIGGYYLA